MCSELVLGVESIKTFMNIIKHILAKVLRVKILSVILAIDASCNSFQFLLEESTLLTIFSHSYFLGLWNDFSFLLDLFLNILNNLNILLFFLLLLLLRFL